MHRIIVDEKRWIGEARFLHALSYCTLLPGPEAQRASHCTWLERSECPAVIVGESHERS
jgi:chromate transporter